MTTKTYFLHIRNKHVKVSLKPMAYMSRMFLSAGLLAQVLP